MGLTEKAKLDIIHSIESEDIFREEVLVPILRQMEKIEEVRVTHGANEKGKDIVLIEKDAFGDYSYTAVIIKNKKITNATTSSKDRETTANVVDQIVLTINSGYDCIKQKRHVDFNKIIVITSLEVSHTAVDEFNKLARRHNFINISVKQDQDIVKWIDKYIPHYFETNSGILSNYIVALRKKCEKLNELRKISLYKGEVKHLLDVFVSPTLHRLQKKETSGKGLQTAPVLGKLERIIFEKPNLLLVAGPGAGKSTVIRAEIQKLLSSNTRGKILNIPFLMKANILLKYLEKKDIEKAVNKYLLEEYELQEFTIEQYFDKNYYNIFLFIDGLDEIRCKEDREELVSSINLLAEKNLNIKIIITSRETDDLESFDIKTFRRWDLLPFNNKQIMKFINQWFAINRSEQILSILKDHELLEKLPNTPLVLTLLAILFDDEQQVEVPSNLAELYQMFIDLLVGRWNLDRRIDNMYKANIIERVLMEIAKRLHESDRYSMSFEEFHDIVVTCWENVGEKVDYDDFERILFEQTSLVVLNDKEEVEFRHLSFQEYLVAKFYSIKNEVSLIDKLKNNFLDDWWSQVVYFYCGIKQDNESLLIDLLEITEKGDLFPSIKAIWNYGYLVQASYITPIKTRKDCIEKEISIYPKKISNLIEGIKNNTIKLEIPQVIIILSFLISFKTHYSSRFLKDAYLEIYNNLIEKTLDCFDDKLKILLITSILADIVSPDYYLEIYDIVKDEPLINLALDFEISQILESKEVSNKNISELKKTSKKIRDKIIKGHYLYNQYFETPKIETNETAATLTDKDVID